MLRTQQSVDRNREKGFKEEAFGPEGTEREPVKKPAFPLSQHQAQHLKNKVFGFSALGWQVGEGCTCKRGALHPWELWMQRQQQQLTTNK